MRNKDLKDVITFVMSTANAIGKSLDDGSISFMDALNFIDPAIKFGEAFIGIDDAYRQFADLSDDDKQDIYDYIDFNYDIDSEHLQPAVENCLKAAVCIGDLVMDFFDKQKG